MTECDQTSFSFPSVKHRKVDVNFNGGEISSDLGMWLLREIDKRLRLTTAIDRVLCDNRVQGRCDDTQLTMLRQRIYALATGYEDLNDHCTLRHDTVFDSFGMMS